MKRILAVLFLTATTMVFAQTAPCPQPPILNNPDGPACSNQMDPCQCSQDFYWTAGVIPGTPPADWWEVQRRTKSPTTAFTPWVFVGKTIELRWWVAWDAGDSSRSQDDGLQHAGQQKPGWTYEYRVRSCRYVPGSWEIVCSQASATVASYKGVAYIRSTR